jgi:hypothetical protein
VNSIGYFRYLGLVVPDPGKYAVLDSILNSDKNTEVDTDTAKSGVPPQNFVDVLISIS